MKKNISLLYFSPTETTGKIVRAVAKGLGGEHKDYNITLPEARKKPLIFDEYAMVIIGVPVYGGRVPEDIVHYFKSIRGNNTLAVFISVFGNRNYDDALIELKDLFEENGFIGMAYGAFVGEHTFTDQVATGRPDERDIEKAYGFGVEIEKKLKNAISTDKLKLEFNKGNRPYKDRGEKSIMNIATKETCTHCGICAKGCPVGAIDSVDFYKVDFSSCIHCCRCIRKCPIGAKSIDDEKFDRLKEWLVGNFGDYRKEPELFI